MLVSRSADRKLDRCIQGSIFLGDGFLLSHAEADRCPGDPRNRDVVFKAINGEELNNQPVQTPQRSVISFHDWPLSSHRVT